MSAGGSTHGSSSTPHSMARPHRLSSIEYGLALVVGTGMPRSLGVVHLLLARASGPTRAPARAPRGRGRATAMPTSKRTWSLPLPVQPCAMYLAWCRCASSTRCLTMIGRLIAERSGYLFSYSALARSALARNSSTYSSRTSLTIDSTAPIVSAFWRTNSRSWRSWPTSIASAMTSTSWFSCSHLMATEVSSPPEYASTTFSRAMNRPSESDADRVAAAANVVHAPRAVPESTAPAS